jgi:hypothetical protein
MKMARGRLPVLFWLMFTASVGGCLEIEVEPQLIPHIPAIPDPKPPAPLVYLSLHGERMEDASWAKALTISRFFFSGVKNRTGSPRDLLEPGIREILRQRGYRVAPELLAPDENENGVAAPVDGDLVFEAFAERNQLLWLPPREFIQTPRARARGTVRVDLAVRSRLFRTHAPVPASPGKTDDPPVGPAIEIWSAEFVANEELRVLPGEEGAGLAAGAALGFQNYLRRLQIDLPPANSLR